MSPTPEHNQPPAGYQEELEMAPAGWSWYVVHARPRCEKKVADLVLQQKGKVFLPLLRKVHFYGRRRRVFWLPLFSGYVFICAPDSLKTWLLQNQNTANVLPVPRQEELVHQLNAVRIAMAAGAQLEVLPYLEAGQKVMIHGGSMKGVEGVVVRTKGKDRVILNVDMIGTAVAMEIESVFLKPS